MNHLIQHFDSKNTKEEATLKPTSAGHWWAQTSKLGPDTAKTTYAQAVACQVSQQMIAPQPYSLMGAGWITASVHARAWSELSHQSTANPQQQVILAHSAAQPRQHSSLDIITAAHLPLIGLASRGWQSAPSSRRWLAANAVLPSTLACSAARPVSRRTLRARTRARTCATATTRCHAKHASICNRPTTPHQSSSMHCIARCRHCYLNVCPDLRLVQKDSRALLLMTRRTR
jgi:hypothetical protein